jgi:polyphosphate kinase 2 (PPK2 family)
MKKSDLEWLDGLVAPHRVTRAKGFRLKDLDPADTGRFAHDEHGEAADKERAKELLARGVEWLAEQQDMLYAQDRWSVLLVFQALDAAGKDGTIKHVMSGVNPQGCSATTGCGARGRRCPRAARSASSTARTTRRCWS